MLYEVDLEVDGHLQGVTVDLLWECLSSKRAFIELAAKKAKAKKKKQTNQSKARIKFCARSGQDLLLSSRFSMKWALIAWTTIKKSVPYGALPASMPSSSKGLPIEFSMTDKLQEIQQQMLGDKSLDADGSSRSYPSHLAHLSD